MNEALEDEALCSYYGWTPEELDKQDSRRIEIFKNIIVGKSKAKDKEMETQRLKREMKR